jgi:ribosomal protein L34E
MAHQSKIATCCYCSSRTILKPSARNGHELACGSCGAPLHEMKWLKAPEPQKKTTRKPSRPAPVKSYKPKKQKRRKPMWKRGLEEAWDIIEDIFD